MFVYLSNEPNSSSSLGLINERVKFKDNNVFVNKIAGMTLDLNIFFFNAGKSNCNKFIRKIIISYYNFHYNLLIQWIENFSHILYY